MNRLLGKHYRTDDACPDPQSVTYHMRYTYDQGTNGKGRRTRMDDASGYTTWTYDDRGRVTQETKVVSGGGTFVTQWGYDALDRVAWMKYPGGNGGQVGEQVNYTYNTRGLLSGVVGYASYVQSQAYDAPGRVTERLLGNGLKTVYAYYSWTIPNGRGRLEWLKTGNNSPDYDSVQKLWYGYDGVGNVLTIRDYKDFMPPYTFYQEQAFTYDDLNRLTSARANGGQYGNYGPENYTYNAIGNLQSKAGMGYTYPASGVGSVHPHGVRRVNGSGGSTKTVTVRAKGVYYSGWPQMKLYVNGTYRCQWTVSSSSYTNYSCNTALSGDDVVEVVYTNDSGSRALYVDYVVVDGLTVRRRGERRWWTGGVGKRPLTG